MDLPSATAARDLVAGDLNALPRVIGWTLMRAVLIGAGVALAGERKHVVRYAVAGAAFVEVWILCWAKLTEGADRPQLSGLGRLVYLPLTRRTARRPDGTLARKLYV